MNICVDRMGRECEAIQFDGTEESADEISQDFTTDIRLDCVSRVLMFRPASQKLSIPAMRGDWFVREPNGMIFIRTDADFADKYSIKGQR